MATVFETSYGIVPVQRGPSGLNFLVVQSRRNHHFFFPKGHKDRYETPIQAATRELWEESGHVPSLFWTGHEWSPNSSLAAQIYREEYLFTKRDGRVTKKVCVYFLASVTQRGEVQDKKEISGVQWMPVEEGSASVFDFETKRMEFLTQVLPCVRSAQDLLG